MALRGLAAELVDERRKVAQLRQEVASCDRRLSPARKRNPTTKLDPAMQGAGGSFATRNDVTDSPLDRALHCLGPG